MKISNTKNQISNKLLKFEIYPFDWAQGGEPVEPFVIWCLGFGILLLREYRPSKYY